LNLEAIAIISVLIVVGTSTILYLTTDWRVSIGLLAVQYIGVALLVGLEWPFGMAVVKLVSGWIAGAVLGMALAGSPELNNNQNSTSLDGETSLPEDSPMDKLNPKTERPVMGRAFYILTTLLVGLVVISQSQRMMVWFPGMRIEQAWGGLLLIGMGLLKLGFTLKPLPAILGLLTALSGFEIIYASLQSSPLIAGILAGITLGLALAGAYLLLTPDLEEAY